MSGSDTLGVIKIVSDNGSPIDFVSAAGTATIPTKEEMLGFSKIYQTFFYVLQ